MLYKFILTFPLCECHSKYKQASLFHIFIFRIIEKLKKKTKKEKRKLKFKMSVISVIYFCNFEIIIDEILLPFFKIFWQLNIKYKVSKI